MSTDWTPNQEKAYKALKGRYLVAAGAGSGKTAVLSERAKFLIEKGEAKIEELLVLTFTNDAAGNMKKRIYEKLLESDNPLAIEAAKHIEDASITTFDSLFFALGREYRAYLGLPDGIAIDGTSILELEEIRILNKIVDELYESKDPKWLSLVYRYCLKDDDNLKSFIHRILDQARYSSDKNEWLDKVEENFFSEAALKKVEKAYYDVVLDYLKEMEESLYKLGGIADPNNYEKAEKYFNKIYGAFNVSLEEGLNLYKLEAKPFGVPTLRGLDEEAKAVWAEFKGFNKELKEFLEPYEGGDIEVFRKAYLKPKDDILYLVELTKELDKRLSKVSKEAGLYSFTDIGNLAREVVKIPEVNEELRKRYKYIMIDEFQDTNHLQESLINNLGIDNLFMVGDAKQSIYGFRKAKVSIFVDKMQKAKTGENDITIIPLADNFRSSKGVISAINKIFSKTMTPEVGGIDYLDGESLIAHRDITPEFDGVEGVVFDSRNYHGPDALAFYIANDITKKIHDKFQVYDSEEKCYRDAKPGDFAVLMSTKNRFPAFKEAFKKKDLPFEILEKDPLYAEDELLVIDSIVNLYFALRNNDIQKLRHCYASIKRSFLFMESDKDIFKALNDDSYLNSDLILNAKKALPRVFKMSVSSFIKFVIDEFNFRNCILLKPNTRNSLLLIDSLLANASSMDRLGYNLEDLLSYFTLLREEVVASSNFKPNTNPDSVVVSTIHASKGLEYPIVYLADLEKSVNLSDANGEWLIDLDEGITIKSDIGITSPLVPLLKIKSRKQLIDEFMRLFYVALTRAKQKIIFVKNDRSFNKDGAPKFEKASYPPTHFRDILNLSELPNLNKRVELVDNGLKYKKPDPEKKKDIKMSFKHLDIKHGIYERKRPSKESLFGGNIAAMLYGEKLHRYMELIDFKNPDLSFISSLSEKVKISKVLELDIFQEAKGGETYQEYEYITKEGELGVIDLLVVYDDHITIIDYKSKNIDDPAYEEQVKTYMSYAYELFDKPVNGFIVSLSDARYKIVK